MVLVFEGGGVVRWWLVDVRFGLVE